MWRNTFDNLLQNMELDRTRFAWLVGLLIIAPAASVAALFVLRALRGGSRLVRPRCPRCRHLQTLRDGALPPACTECGSLLGSGVPWVRPSRTVLSSLAFGTSAVALLGVAILGGGLTFAVISDRTSGWRRNFESISAALAGREGDRALRAGMSALRGDAMTGEQVPMDRAARLLLEAVRTGGRESAIASAARTAGQPGSFLGVSRIVALLVGERAMHVDEAEEILTAIDAIPSLRVVSVGVSGGEYRLNAVGGGDCAFVIDSATIDGVPVQFGIAGTGSSVGWWARLPAGALPVTLDVRWTPALVNSAESRLRQRHFSATIDLRPKFHGDPPLVTDGLRPQANPEQQPVITLKPLGVRQTVRVALPRPTSGVAWTGRWTLEIAGATVPLFVTGRVDGTTKGPVLEGLLPLALGNAELIGAATVRVEYEPTQPSATGEGKIFGAWPTTLEWTTPSIVREP
ncbi:MAG: hypothetical protein SGJ09_05555 [Phycisphaerae bacterium]|nr:hypothetical protein [Phycisphaerae bacterium]